MLLHHVIKEFPYYDEKDSRVKLSFNDFSHLCMINPGIKVFFAMGMTVQFLAIYFYLCSSINVPLQCYFMHKVHISLGRWRRNRSSYFVPL